MITILFRRSPEIVVNRVISSRGLLGQLFEKMTWTPSDRSSYRWLLRRGGDLAARSSRRGEHLLWGRGCAECDLAHSNHGRHTAYFPVSSCGNRHGVRKHGFWGHAALTGSELGFEPGQWDARDYSPNHGDSWQLLCILWIMQIAPQDLHMSSWSPRWSFAKLLLFGPHQRCPGFMQPGLSSQGHCGIWKCKGLCLTATKTGQRHVGPGHSPPAHEQWRTLLSEC